MNPRSDLVKLFSCSTCSLQAALYVVTGQLSKVVGRLKDLFKGYCTKCDLSTDINFISINSFF